MVKLVLVYLVIINALGFVLMLTDKYKARKNLWRIPEKALFAVAVLGGSLGCLMGMYAVRHKTKHLSFTVGMPMILLVQLMVAMFLYVRTG